MFQYLNNVLVPLLNFSHHYNIVSTLIILTKYSIRCVSWFNRSTSATLGGWQTMSMDLGGSATNYANPSSSSLLVRSYLSYLEYRGGTTAYA